MVSMYLSICLSVTARMCLAGHVCMCVCFLGRNNTHTSDPKHLDQTPLLPSFLATYSWRTWPRIKVLPASPIYLLGFFSQSTHHHHPISRSLAPTLGSAIPSSSWEDDAARWASILSCSSFAQERPTLEIDWEKKESFQEWLKGGGELRTVEEAHRGGKRKECYPSSLVLKTPFPCCFCNLVRKSLPRGVSFSYEG